MLDRNRQNTKNSITPSFYMFYRISYLIARGFDNFASRSVLLLTEKNQMKKSDHNFFTCLGACILKKGWTEEKYPKLSDFDFHKNYK